MFCVWNFSLCDEVNFSELICESGMKITPRYALKAFNNKRCQFLSQMKRTN